LLLLRLERYDEGKKKIKQQITQIKSSNKIKQQPNKQAKHKLTNKQHWSNYN
jgi:hypothetical protein